MKLTKLNLFQQKLDTEVKIDDHAYNFGSRGGKKIDVDIAVTNISREFLQKFGSISCR